MLLAQSTADEKQQVIRLIYSKLIHETESIIRDKKTTLDARKR